MFKVGQLVKLVDNNGMAAPLGATAVIRSVSTELIDVEWKTNFNRQGNGGYYPHHFRPVFTKNQQLLFNFME